MVLEKLIKALQTLYNSVDDDGIIRLQATEQCLKLKSSLCPFNEILGNCFKAGKL
jgi:hypothetical protein